MCVCVCVSACVRAACRCSQLILCRSCSCTHSCASLARSSLHWATTFTSYVYDYPLTQGWVCFGPAWGAKGSSGAVSSWGGARSQVNPGGARSNIILGGAADLGHSGATSCWGELGATSCWGQFRATSYHRRSSRVGSQWSSVMLGAARRHVNTWESGGGSGWRGWHLHQVGAMSKCGRVMVEVGGSVWVCKVAALAPKQGSI